MRTTRKSSIRLQVETLECRAVPAGGVTSTLTSLVSGEGPYTLSLDGDSAGNQIRVVHVSPREVQVIGEGGTLIDGQSSKTILLPNENETDVIQQVFIDLGNGDDTVTQVVPDGAYPFHELLITRIETGNGDDSVTVLANLIRGLGIVTGNGNDQVILSATPGSLVRWGSFGIHTGAGDDGVLLQTNAIHPSDARVGSFEIHAGNGHDVVRFDGTGTISNDADILLGNGDDHLVGDPTRPPIHLEAAFFAAYGEGGHDTVDNSAYFAETFWLYPPDFYFEEVN